MQVSLRPMDDWSSACACCSSSGGGSGGGEEELIFCRESTDNLRCRSREQGAFGGFTTCLHSIHLHFEKGLLYIEPKSPSLLQLLLLLPRRRRVPT